MSTGIKFHTDGAAERKAREPITVLIRGTVRVLDSDDLKRRPDTYGLILHARHKMADQSTIVCRLEQQF